MVFRYRKWLGQSLNDLSEGDDREGSGSSGNASGKALDEGNG